MGAKVGIIFETTITIVAQQAKKQGYLSLRRNELSTTLRLEHAIRALAHMGVMWNDEPKRQGTPAAKGMHTRL